MSEELKYIDDLFKETLSDNTVASTPANIEGASKLIGKFNFLHFSFNTFNIYYTSLIILLITFGAIFFNMNNSEIKESMRSNDFGRNLSKYRNVAIPADTIEFEPTVLVLENNIQKTKTTETNTEVTKTKNIPLDIDTTSEEDDINAYQDTMVIYKRVIIADTVRTIIYQKIRPKKNQKKD